MTGAPLRNSERRSKAFKVAAFVVLVGPLAGLVPLLVLALARMPIGYPLTADGLQSVAVILLFAGLYAYIFAGIPCLIAAAWLGRLTYTRGTFGWLAALSAAIVSTMLGGLILGYLTSPENSRNAGLAMFMMPFAIFSALLCRYLMIRTGILPSADDASLAEH